MLEIKYFPLKHEYNLGISLSCLKLLLKNLQICEKDTSTNMSTLTSLTSVHLKSVRVTFFSSVYSESKVKFSNCSTYS